MRLCRFENSQGHAATGLSKDGRKVLELPSGTGVSLTEILESPRPAQLADKLWRRGGRIHRAGSLRWLPPVERQEIWAAGVTYLRSRKARVEESEHEATAYDRVYEAQRPELFFKSVPSKVVGPDGTIGIRRDSSWSVPEPELALVANSRGKWVGCTMGNDVSARDIEGENLLYLPQAKVYTGSCALGPWILLETAEAAVRRWKLRLSIRRRNRLVFRGQTSIGNLRRGFDELIRYLFTSQSFPEGVILLTGTGIVPPDTFTLRSGDDVRIETPALGSLRNEVRSV